MLMACPCGASNSHLKQYFSVGETDFRCCTICGCVFRARFPNRTELDEIYRQAYAKKNICSSYTNQESGDYASHSYAKYLMSQVIKTGDRYLDFGAGTGILLQELRRFGLVGDGVEFSASAREYCLTNRNFSLKSDLRDVPDGFYQVISMIEVIEHLTDLNGTLKDIFRVLAPGGRLFVTTPSRTGLRARLENGRWREAQKKFHLFLFDMKSLDFHIKRTGFLDVKRNVYSPLQKKGWKFWIYSRLIQSIGLSGTLCVVAKK